MLSTKQVQIISLIFWEVGGRGKDNCKSTRDEKLTVNPTKCGTESIWSLFYDGVCAKMCTFLLVLLSANHWNNLGSSKDWYSLLVVILWNQVQPVSESKVAHIHCSLDASSMDWKSPYHLRLHLIKLQLILPQNRDKKLREAHDTICSLALHLSWMVKAFLRNES